LFFLFHFSTSTWQVSISTYRVALSSMALATAQRMVPMQAVQKAVHVHASSPLQGGYVKQQNHDHGVDLQRADPSSPRQGSSCSYSILEAALEAWMDFQPDGYTIAEKMVPFILAKLAYRVSDARSGQSDANAEDVVRDLFSSELDVDLAAAEKPARFQGMLTAHNGFIHFLYFWSAFSEAMRYCTCGGAQATKEDEMLSSEFELLRDGLLATIGDAPITPETNVADLRLQSDKLVEVVQVVASRSSSPRFWTAAAKAFSGIDEIALLSLDDLTVVIMCWHRDAIAWQHDRPATHNAASSQSESREACLRKEHNSTFKEERETFRGGLPVFVHIYDVSQEDSVKKFNKYMASRYSPIKFGGIFHAGVEVNGLEWSYGVSYTDTVPGLSCIEPRTHPAHSYRQTVQLRRTKMNAEEIADLLMNLIEEYPGDDYCLLRRNCCHFADDFCRRLGSGRIPGWIHRLARLGARVDGALQLIGRQLPMMSAGDSSSDEDA
jgi:hypothetical protein